MAKRDPKTLELAEPFVSLFPVEPETLELVTDSIRERGFQIDKPILAWRDAFKTPGRYVVVDGHTRLRAALDLKLREVPVTGRQYKSVDEAITAGIGEQVQRRNLNREQIAAFVIATLPLLDETEFGLRTRTATELAKLLGVSKPTIDRARSLLNSGHTDLIDAVKHGDMSLLAAWKESLNGGTYEEADADVPRQQTSPDASQDRSLAEADQLAAAIEAAQDRDEINALFEKVRALKRAMQNDEASERRWQALNLLAEARWNQLYSSKEPEPRSPEAEAAAAAFRELEERIAADGDDLRETVARTAGEREASPSLADMLGAGTTFQTQEGLVTNLVFYLLEIEERLRHALVGRRVKGKTAEGGKPRTFVVARVRFSLDGVPYVIGGRDEPGDTSRWVEVSSLTDVDDGLGGREEAGDA